MAKKLILWKELLYGVFIGALFFMLNWPAPHVFNIRTTVSSFIWFVLTFSVVYAPASLVTRWFIDKRTIRLKLEKDANQTD